MTPGLFVLLAALLGQEVGAGLPPPFPAPPWTPGSDETRLTNTAPFGPCETLAKMLAAKTNGHVADRTYFVGIRWGKVYRSRVVESLGGEPVTSLLTCWRGSDHGFHFVTKIEGT